MTLLRQSEADDLGVPKGVPGADSESAALHSAVQKPRCGSCRF
jgi:hypothetical protein